MQWFQDYKAVVTRHSNLSIGQRLYCLLRLLICPFGQVEAFLPKAGLIVDVGCGYGVFSNLIAVRSPKRHVWGCDIEAGRISTANSVAHTNSNISFCVSTVKDLQLPACDAVTMIDLLHHIHPQLQESIIRESFEKLKANGILVIKDIDTQPFPKYAFNYLHDFIVTRGEPLYFAGRSRLCELLERVGFNVTVHRLKTWAPYPHILLLCRKGN